jgi:hypothetical protein
MLCMCMCMCLLSNTTPISHIPPITHYSYSLLLPTTPTHSLKGLKGLPNLAEIDISYNTIKTLDGLEHNPTLKILRCNHNHLTTLRIPMTYSQQHNTKKTTTTTTIAKGNGNGSGSTTLNRNSNSNSNNNNKKIKSSAVIVDSNYSQSVGLQLLSDVYVNGNRLKGLSGLETLGPNIETLDLSGNKITRSALFDEVLTATTTTTAGGANANAGTIECGLKLLINSQKLAEVRFSMNPCR